MTIDEFVASIKRNEKPFVYQESVNRPFMLSYDMDTATVNEHFGGDFRPFIIAALHVKGARKMKSYVATTIYYEADSKNGRTWDALVNWKSFLNTVFDKKLKLMICAIRETEDNEAIFDKIANPSIEAEFDTRRDTVISKF